MSRKLESIQSGTDACNYALNHKKTKSYRWSGDHLTVEGPQGRGTLARSKYEYPPYVRRKIITMLIAIGLGCFLIVEFNPQILSALHLLGV